jgi:hypothetical protein
VLNKAVRELYEDWMAESDEDTAELIYSAYLHALRQDDEDVDDDFADDLHDLRSAPPTMTDDEADDGPDAVSTRIADAIDS